MLPVTLSFECANNCVSPLYPSNCTSAYLGKNSILKIMGFKLCQTGKQMLYQMRWAFPRVLSHSPSDGGHRKPPSFLISTSHVMLKFGVFQNIIDTCEERTASLLSLAAVTNWNTGTVL